MVSAKGKRGITKAIFGTGENMSAQQFDLDIVRPADRSSAIHDATKVVRSCLEASHRRDRCGDAVSLTVADDADGDHFPRSGCSSH
jgi:hypothetical protein